MRRGLLIVFCLCCLSLQAAVFQKSYYDTPLYVVLQDLERHFGCSFMCRPQDVANAPTVTASFSTGDYAAVLRKVLGSQLVYTKRKNILIISQTTKKEGTSIPPSVVSNQNSIVSAPVDTISEDTVQVERVWLPIEMLRPGIQLAISPIDTIRIAHLRIEKPSVTSTHTSEYNRQKPVVSGHYLKHSFLSSLSLGYGSEINTQLDLEYVFFFHKNWGFSSGLAFDYAGQYGTSWAHELRFALPLALRTQWIFSPLWGLQGTTGIQVWFPMANPNGTESQPFAIASNSVDMAVYAELDAAYVLSPNVTLLFGLYGRFSALSSALTPWSTGRHVGFLIGK